MLKLYVSKLVLCRFFWEHVVLDEVNTPKKSIIIIIIIFFYSGIDASFPEILLWFLPPLRRLWGKLGSNPGLLRDSLISASGLNH
jgi:hypothetical protein